jgi:cytochrome c-type biogenesis protein
VSDVLNPALAFAAGALTILSPCVLPLVPIVMGSAAQKHRAGPFALAAGLVASFTIIGFLLATVGAQANFDGEIVRKGGAILMIVAGAFLAIPSAQDWLARAAAPLANWAQARQSGLERYGLVGQAMIGALLGLVWSPCVGPTLGAATVLAAQGQNLGQVALTMLAFALGIATLLVAIAFATRSLMSRWRGSLMSGGARGKMILGALLIIVALLILTGADKMVESYIVSISPDWLNDLTTTF